MPHTCLGRSPVPDLLYESDQIHRLEEIRDLLEQPEAIRANTPLHRLTVFLTYACNLACPYCKTISRGPEDLLRFPQKRYSLRLPDFIRLLDQHQGTPIRHLHFTGGEATLIASLPEMIQTAKARGIDFVSLTSNGVRPPAFYTELIAQGLDELRISLDAAEPVGGAQLTQRSQAWEQTVATLAHLSQLRQQHPFYLIVNAVIGPDNRRQIPDLLNFLAALCDPDDIKLITEVDHKAQLADFPELDAVRQAARHFLAQYPAERFPLLRRKVQTVFAADAIGLEHIQPDERPWRCYIPLTERTVDSQYYYPCSVYLREGGQPLGPLSDSPALQRQKSALFVRDEDCLQDPICSRYCLHCTRMYNERCHAAG